MSMLRKVIRNPGRVAAKVARRARIKLLPPPAAHPERLTGKLARDGGSPVRDTKYRPWPEHPSSSISDWLLRVGPTMARSFLTGTEGLPQPLANKFAQQWAAYCGTQYGLMMPHGTDALRAALATTLNLDGLEYGGEVIVPNLTFIASASAALDRRLGVALVDVDPETLLIDPRRVEEAIIPGKTRAIMAVHLFGHPADMTALRDIALRHSLVVIEDAAQAHGAIHELGPAGSLGTVAAFSFQSTKTLTSGEGGALTTNDPEIYEQAYMFHNVGRALKGGQRWGHESLGYNYRPSEYIAAVLLHRFRTFEAKQQIRVARFTSLHKQLSEIKCVEPVALGPGLKRHGAYIFPMRYRPEHCGGLRIEDFISAVQSEGIPLNRGYTSTLSQQPAMQRVGEKHPDYLRVLPTPVADQAVREFIFLNHNLLLGTDSDMKEITATFLKVQAHFAPQRRKGISKGTISRPVDSPTITVTAMAQERPAIKIKRIRTGVIGVGVMGQQHAEIISSNPKFTLAGVADAEPKIGQRVAADLNCHWFESPEELIRHDHLDAIAIATPHWQHPELVIAGLRAGLHVICEKPLAVTVADADEVLRVAAESQGVFAMVHQRRFEPAYHYVKQLLDSGELGQIYRCSMVEAAWRSEAYYRSAPWRGTWEGEGGGVLVNQAPHLLDRYAWLCGMPTSVLARCDTNLHSFEVEDMASAILRHANGLHGYIHVNTIEAPPVSRAVISCDRGRVVIDNGRVQITRLLDSIRDRNIHDTELMGNLESDTREIDISQMAVPTNLHNAFYEDFAAAVSGTGKLICPGREGIMAVELANAIMLSSSRGAPVTLPLDREEYSQWIHSVISRSGSKIPA